jgi:transcriptional regulator with XRE-family HTH domain
MTPQELRAAREAMGITQQELADKLGVGQGTISRWEAGERQPPPLLDLALERLQGRDWSWGA